MQFSGFSISWKREASSTPPHGSSGVWRRQLTVTLFEVLNGKTATLLWNPNFQVDKIQLILIVSHHHGGKLFVYMKHDNFCPIYHFIDEDTYSLTIFGNMKPGHRLLETGSANSLELLVTRQSSSAFPLLWRLSSSSILMFSSCWWMLSIEIWFNPIIWVLELWSRQTPSKSFFLPLVNLDVACNERIPHSDAWHNATYTCARWSSTYRDNCRLDFFFENGPTTLFMRSPLRGNPWSTHRAQGPIQPMTLSISVWQTLAFCHEPGNSMQE